jgi:uncharacterized protein (DUF305 family)
MPFARGIAFILAVALSAFLISACGGDDEESAGGGEHTTMGHTDRSNSPRAAVDRAFAAAMIPHHESAIEAATIARQRAQSGFVKQLARDITSSQQSEIRTLKRIDGELKGSGAKVGDLGVAEHMRGMQDDPADLRDADPFDRAFVDMMVPHHQGAIEMAKAELAEGENAELKKLAQAIIDAQQREIDEMNKFREREYGSPVPSSTGGHEG